LLAAEPLYADQVNYVDYAYVHEDPTHP
jgi:hypothetical protein